MPGTRKRSYFHRFKHPKRKPQMCPACEAQVPCGALYCMACGVQLLAAARLDSDRCKGEELVLNQLPDSELRNVLKGRRKRAPVLAARAALLYESLAAQQGREMALSCLDELDFVPRDYQIEAALTVLGRMHGRAILADEVGLGKTIEAGLMLKELLRRGLLQRGLILVPSSLVEQWREELSIKFGLKNATHDSPRFWRSDLLLLSLSRAKQPATARRLAKGKWDLVVVDEAHALKNARTVAHRFVRSLEAHRLLLLTATPIENDLRELYNLLTLVDTAAYPTFRQFSRDFLVSRFKVRDGVALRRFCRRYMVRNRRHLAFPEIPPRSPRLVACHADPEEKEFLTRVLRLVRWLYNTRVQGCERAGRRGDAHAFAGTMLLLTLLLKESCSSPQATCATLEQVIGPELEGEELAHLEGVLALGRGLAATGKMRRFLEELRNSGTHAAVVYAEYFATHEVLSKLLREMSMRVIPFTGKMSAAEKSNNLDLFRKEGGILLCTDVGGQGLNLQHCNMVVNFDIPWNPMKLEQRIGRVHRYGQTRPTQVLNMVTAGSYDERVFQLLARKLELFTQAVGELEAILSFVEEGDESLQQLLTRAICKADDEAAMAANLEVVSEQLGAAVQRYRRSRDATSLVLDGEEDEI